MSEIMDCLLFLGYVYEILGYTFELVLSTKPDKALGNDAIWEQAEE
jgi:threonyl-tRNA synthetase